MSRSPILKRSGFVILQWSISILSAWGQQVPPSADRPWAVPQQPGFKAALAQVSAVRRGALDPEHLYTLPELIDLAEKNNPETRVLWEQAKQRAALAGIARSALFPTLAVLASASFSQYSLFVTRFYHEDLATFPATLNLNYTVLDFGSRRAKIDQANANLLAADFRFNDAHRKIIFQVVEAYYRLLDAVSHEKAADATLKDAQTVQQAIEARLAHGLATLPDVLEARAATAQAEYELTSIRGLEEIAHGVLANVLGISPPAPFHVEDVSEQLAAETVDQPIEAILKRATGQRPDLLAHVAEVESADAAIRQAHSAYYPDFSFLADWGHGNSYGSQNSNPVLSSHIYPYSVQLRLNWTVFDGGERRNQLARAEAQRQESQAQYAASRDQIEDEVWTSYANLKTARIQQQAAESLLQAAEQSYSAATESFQAGVRTFIDVTTAQRDLARARTAEASARIQVLAALADLTFRAGDPHPASASSAHE